MRKIFVILSIVFCIFPIHKLLAQTDNSNVGFIQKDIWYSNDNPTEGDKIKIYTLTFNPDVNEFSGIVSFYDKDILLGQKSFSLSSNTAKPVYVNWTANVGDHEIFAKIENAKFLMPNGEYQTVTLAKSETEKSTFTVAKKIIPTLKDTTNTNFNAGMTDNSDTGLVANIENGIKNNIPSFIIKPVTDATNNIENFRKNISTTSDDKKEQAKNEIKVLSNNSNEQAFKPFKYVELFLWSLVSFVLNNRLLFYGALLAGIFFLSRFIWRKIF